ncbi:subclass B3 metallo-beta-lactamase [Sphingomonas sp. XMGL2]|uniref:Subclass B3 metallo-beta-lactamase n=2 Tax=Sphingomonas quercus TaxID=2842451 RepID=A0ABS6BLY8_9SPHN|nr:subclass B3 metallo-beta-lactamase [Sphingomonas quercus]
MLALTAICSGAAAVAQGPVDPLTRPIEPDYAARWLGEQAPVKVYGNSYIVGFAGLNVALIRTAAGLILIDAAVPQAVPALEANIRKLGFRVEDIRLILSTEPHWDHAGGLAAVARDSRATVVASSAGAAALRVGHNDASDPQSGEIIDFPGVRRLRIVRDGEVIRLGGVAVTARATPGHTAGSMSWTWRSCEAGRCLNMVFASSLNPVSREGYRFSDPAHRAVVESYRRSFQVMRALPCDVLLSSHPDQSGGDLRHARLATRPETNPFVDARACRAYAGRFAAALADRLAREGSSLGR